MHSFGKISISTYCKKTKTNKKNFYTILTMEIFWSWFMLLSCCVFRTSLEVIENRANSEVSKKKKI